MECSSGDSERDIHEQTLKFLAKPTTFYENPDKREETMNERQKMKHERPRPKINFIEKTTKCIVIERKSMRPIFFEFDY